MRGSDLIRGAGSIIDSTARAARLDAIIKAFENTFATIRKNSGATTLQRARTNFIEGSARLTITIADDGVNNEVKLTLDVPSNAFEVAGAIAAHLAAANPHPQYAFAGGGSSATSFARSMLLGGV